jgi:hypothetical protein
MDEHTAHAAPPPWVSAGTADVVRTFVLRIDVDIRTSMTLR